MLKDSLCSLPKVFIIAMFTATSHLLEQTDGKGFAGKKKSQQHKSVRLKQRKKEIFGEEALQGVIRALHIVSIF